MRLLRALLPALLLLGTAAAPAAAADGSRLGTPEFLTAFSGESYLLAGSSSEGHADAFAVFHRVIGRNLYTVVYPDPQGERSHFDLPFDSGSYPLAVRLVALEDGGGMALWDDGRTNQVLARSWTRDGALSETQVVLSEVEVSKDGDYSTAQWRVRSNGQGTVVVATTGAAPRDPASVFAVVRDPGGAFGPQQELTPAGETGPDQRPLSISPIAADDSVTVSWGTDGDPARGGRATRTGRSATFGESEQQAYTQERESGLSADGGSIVLDDGASVAVSSELASACPCLRPLLFTWADGRRVLTFQRYGSEPPESGAWFVARPDAQGTFDRPRRATTNASSFPVRRARSGEVGFARFDTNTDFNLFRQRSRLVVVPYGSLVPRSTHAADARFGTSTRDRKGLLPVPVYCDRVCTVGGSAGDRHTLAVTNSLTHPVARRLEPFSVAYLRVPVSSRRTSVRVTLRATDDAGHRSSSRARFKRIRRTSQWCRAGSAGC